MTVASLRGSGPAPAKARGPRGILATLDQTYVGWHAKPRSRRSACCRRGLWMRKEPLSWALVLGLALLLNGGCDVDRRDSMRLVRDGSIVLAQQGHAAAIGYFDAAVAKDPTNAWAHHYVGLLRLHQFHDAERALPSLARAVQLDPDNADFRYQFGLALDRLGYQDQAEGEYLAALRLDPGDFAPAYRLGLLYERRGSLLDAIDHLMRAIIAKPDFDEAYHALGSLYMNYGRPQEAIRVLENGLRLGANPTFNFAELGRVYLQIGEGDLAISYLRQAAERAGTPPAVYYNLGVALHRRFRDAGRDEDRRDAEHYLRRAQVACLPHREPARCSALASLIQSLSAEQPR